MSFHKESYQQNLFRCNEVEHHYTISIITYIRRWFEKSKEITYGPQLNNMNSYILMHTILYPFYSF